mmetsp:Transcript_11959/g.34271  ORF Transcript_11959/g.34271 Transcript_11959/m.34271 type:complete len:208 (-) Transcript_11959:1080-1703(-)
MIRCFRSTTVSKWNRRILNFLGHGFVIVCDVWKMLRKRLAMSCGRWCRCPCVSHHRCPHSRSLGSPEEYLRVGRPEWTHSCKTVRKRLLCDGRIPRNSGSRVTLEVVCSEWATTWTMICDVWCRCSWLRRQRCPFLRFLGSRKECLPVGRQKWINSCKKDLKCSLRDEQILETSSGIVKLWRLRTMICDGCCRGPCHYRQWRPHFCF